ncbi:hypothetical protein PG999_008617 [Apiospora kogelbergensis]|uniref:Uncharacterized protein n=1 Tax=Apiospora kogelbergensis TaxID=1337665 RepID=A0AAW0QJ45_9PEZI
MVYLGAEKENDGYDCNTPRLTSGCSGMHWVFLRFEENPVIWDFRSLSDHKNVYYQEGQPGFTYIVQMQDGTQKLSKTGELFALHRDGHLATTGLHVNLKKAKAQTITLRNPQNSTVKHHLLGSRIVLERTHDYSMTHCVPDFRPDPRAGSIIMPRSYRDQFCILFLENKDGPCFTVAWVPSVARSLQQCSVNDIDDVKQALGSQNSLRSDEEYWEMAKDAAQANAKHIVISLFERRHGQKKATQKDRMVRDGLEITAELVEERLGMFLVPVLRGHI